VAQALDLITHRLIRTKHIRYADASVS